MNPLLAETRSIYYVINNTCAHAEKQVICANVHKSQAGEAWSFDTRVTHARQFRVVVHSAELTKNLWLGEKKDELGNGNYGGAIQARS